MPKYQSPRKKRALSHGGDNYSDSEDDFEDEKDDDFSFEYIENRICNLIGKMMMI